MNNYKTYLNSKRNYNNLKIYGSGGGKNEDIFKIEPFIDFDCDKVEHGKIRKLNRFFSFLHNYIKKSKEKEKEKEKEDIVDVYKIVKIYKNKIDKKYEDDLKNIITNNLYKNTGYNSGIPANGKIYLDESIFNYFYKNVNANKWLYYDKDLLKKSKENLRELEVSLSGEGSNIKNTINVINILLNVISALNITQIWDVACGDFLWMPQILEKIPNIKYIGTDISNEIIKQNKEKYEGGNILFYNINISKNIDHIKNFITLEEKTLVLSRDVLQHMTLDSIDDFLKNILNSNSSYYISSNYMYNNSCVNMLDIIEGGTNNRNLFIEPYKLPPTTTFAENIHANKDPNNKFLSLWEIQNGEFIATNI